MRDLITHEKVQHMIRKKSQSPDKKKKTVTIAKPTEKLAPKDQLKMKMKEDKKETKERADTLIKNFSNNNESNKEIVIGNELSNQEESFKSRLQKKKLARVNSQPHNIMAVILLLIYHFIEQTKKFSEQ